MLKASSGILLLPVQTVLKGFFCPLAKFCFYAVSPDCD